MEVITSMTVESDVRFECSCFAAALLGAVSHLAGGWWWWQVEESAPVLATLKRRLAQDGWLKVVREGTVSREDAAALGFDPDRQGRTTVTAVEALHRKTEPIKLLPNGGKGWLRPCPACGRVPDINRRDLYALADAAVAEGVRTVTVPV